MCSYHFTSPILISKWKGWFIPASDIEMIKLRKVNALLFHICSAVSRIWIQLPFFTMPYFGRQGECLGMKWADNLRKQVTFATVIKRSAVNPLVGSKPSLINHLTVPHPDIGVTIKIMKNSKNRGGFTQVKAIFFSYKQTCTDILWKQGNPR